MNEESTCISDVTLHLTKISGESRDKQNNTKHHYYTQRHQKTSAYHTITPYCSCIDLLLQFA